MAKKRLPAATERERPLELSAHRQDRLRTLERQLNRSGGVAARTSQRLLHSVDDARDGIVAAHMDGPVVNEKKVGDSG
jgi:hypothetical protein